MAARTAYVPRWLKVEDRTCCSRCGALVETAWRWYSEPGTYTWAFCEVCVEQLMDDDKEV